MEPLPIRDFEFATVMLDASGEVTARSAHHAREFLQSLSDGIELALVSIPGGSFTMGSFGKQGYDDERPQHRVTVGPFWLGRYPITQAQWRAVMGTNPSGRFKGDQRPVDNVSWQDAHRFCERLSRRTGHACHLPTEAQWEYACRAGTTTPFSFGETLTTGIANYNGEFTWRSGPRGLYRHVTTDVGSFPPNAFGLCDMHGNVWEWCADAWHESYEGAPGDGRAWQAGGDPACRVARGGCWHDTPDVCRSPARLKLAANEGDEFGGFRVAMAA
jgi:formylglycine-generating enzyme required for sulfatase activity